MVFGGVGRPEAKRLGDFGPGGRKAGARHGLADEIEDFLLAFREFGGHGDDPLLRTVWIYSAILEDPREKSKPQKKSGAMGSASRCRPCRAYFSTAAMPAATASMLRLLSAATQMRPLETA
ncbi:Uncharacterised protein [Bordetella pertussis]|nr:Uncharacterised protein [Bordetella pertussis]CFT89285.1 Uncharacterised protein [Bordetella pertussis]CPI58318.1 Uncharacterised protein [Bordetella pertussis]